MKDFLSKLFNAIFGLFVGLLKGLKYLLMILPIAIVALFVCLIFFNEQTMNAVEVIKSWFPFIK
ncbi:MAG: hypothetical protein IJF75_01130 [Clostridia bacterium]|nr:hypothetical protein [Clostridia bacterium]